MENYKEICEDFNNEKLGSCNPFVIDWDDSETNSGWDPFEGDVAKVDTDKCVGCGTCVNECPQGAITMNDDDIAEVNLDECIGCGQCEFECPQGVIMMYDDN